jgi:hypothetical protein
MTVASVFGHNENLEQLSATCLRVCRGPIDPLDLPISHNVIGESPSYLGVVDLAAHDSTRLDRPKATNLRLLGLG